MLRIKQSRYPPPHPIKRQKLKETQNIHEKPRIYMNEAQLLKMLKRNTLSQLISVKSYISFHKPEKTVCILTMFCQFCILFRDVKRYKNILIMCILQHLLFTCVKSLVQQQNGRFYTERGMTSPDIYFFKKEKKTSLKVSVIGLGFLFC